MLYGWAASAALLVVVALGASLLAGACSQTLECRVRADGSCAPGPCDVRLRYEMTVLGFSSVNLLAALAGIALVTWRRGDELGNSA